MASFTSLPAEIVLEIIETTSLHDIESLTLTCKSLYHLGRSRLEVHHQRQRNESDRCIVIGTNADLHGPCKIKFDPKDHFYPLFAEQPLAILADIIEDPDFALYCTHFSIGNCNFKKAAYPRFDFVWDEEFAKTMPWPSERAKDMVRYRCAMCKWMKDARAIVSDYRKQIIKLLADCPYISREELVDWYEGIFHQENQAYIAALLITLMPNLQILTLKFGSFNHDPVRTILHRMGRFDVVMLCTAEEDCRLYINTQTVCI